MLSCFGGLYGASQQTLHVSSLHLVRTGADCNDSPVNLTPFGLENGLGRQGGAEVFHPTADPSGLITATVKRN